MKKYNYEPKDILNYVENQGTKVYFIDNASKLLNPVGENEGFIKNCTNNAFVNTQRSEINIDIEDIDLSSFDSLGKDSSFEDIGGIAGINAGEVLDSLNNGEIGYQHVGYNVGGIVGRNCGYIYNCINQAKIDGRKDVGGIVGHSEPDIINDISSSPEVVSLSVKIRFGSLSFQSRKCVLR